MMGIGFPELMVILIIIMIIFGAGKLPQIGSAFGRSIKNFKTSMKEAEEESSDPEGSQEVSADSPPAEGETAEAAPAQPASTSSPAQSVPKVSAGASKPAPAKTSAKAPAPGQAKAKGKTSKKAKSEEEKMIEDAIKELKEKRIGTIKTPHDGLVQQGDVFTESVKRNPWGSRRDRGVSRDVL